MWAGFPKTISSWPPRSTRSSDGDADALTFGRRADRAIAKIRDDCQASSRPPRWRRGCRAERPPRPRPRVSRCVARARHRCAGGGRSKDTCLGCGSGWGPGGSVDDVDGRLPRDHACCTGREGAHRQGNCAFRRARRDRRARCIAPNQSDARRCFRAYSGSPARGPFERRGVRSARSKVRCVARTDMGRAFSCAARG
jgi:hypothetical protein